MFKIIKLLKINIWFRDGYYKIWPLFIVLFSLFPVFFQGYFFSKQVWQNLQTRAKLTRVIISSFVMLLAVGSFYFNDGFWYFIVYFFIVFPLVISISSGVFDTGISGIGAGINIFFKTILANSVLNLTLLILLFIIYLSISSPILNFIIEAIINGLKLSDIMINEIQKLIVLIVGMTVLFTLIPLYLFGNTLYYFSNKEKISAGVLRTRLEKIWA